MADIKLSLSLPNNTLITIRPDKTDKIKECFSAILAENNISGRLDEFELYREHVRLEQLDITFENAGFAYGDLVKIIRRKAPDVIVPASSLPEIEEVLPNRIFHQLGIFLLDGSESMKELVQGRSLAQQVNSCMSEFLGYFKTSSLRNNFSIAVVTFDIDARIHTPITELDKIDDFADFDPLEGHGRGTNIGSALQLAEEITETFLQHPEATSLPYDVKIVILSDGICLYADSTRIIANRLKQNSRITICSTLFTTAGRIGDSSTDDAKSLLAEIASEPKFYKTTYKEADLRKFFIASMSAKRKYGN